MWREGRRQVAFHWGATDCCDPCGRPVNNCCVAACRTSLWMQLWRLHEVAVRRAGGQQFFSGFAGPWRSMMAATLCNQPGLRCIVPLKPRRAPRSLLCGCPSPINALSSMLLIFPAAQRNPCQTCIPVLPLCCWASAPAFCAPSCLLRFTPCCASRRCHTFLGTPLTGLLPQISLLVWEACRCKPSPLRTQLQTQMQRACCRRRSASLCCAAAVFWSRCCGAHA